jgi:hypothetical protein
MGSWLDSRRRLRSGDRAENGAEKHQILSFGVELSKKSFSNMYVIFFEILDTFLDQKN